MLYLPSCLGVMANVIFKVYFVLPFKTLDFKENANLAK